MKYNVKTTAYTIDCMAAIFEKEALELREIADRMRKEGDLFLAAEAVNRITCIFLNLRLDLLVSHPLREAVRGDKEQ